MTAMAAGHPYAARLEIDYPPQLDRLSSALRLIWAIPIVLVLMAMNTGVLGFSTMLMILFREKYPRWWFDWNLQLTRFTMRINAYFALLTDQYPSTDEEQSVHLDLDYPDVPRDRYMGGCTQSWIQIHDPLGI